MLRKSFVCAGALVGLLCSVMGARAQVTLTFSPDTLSGVPGSTVTFTGTITNSSGATVFLNGDSFNLIGAGLTLDDTKFFTNAPLTLADGASSGPIDLFDVLIDPTTALGAYPGSFTVQGGADSSASDILATGGFTLDVAPAASPSTPEPGAFSLLVGLGTPLSLLAWHRRRRR